MRKVVFVVVGVFVSSFALGRAQSLINHQGFAGSAAFAQAWADSNDSPDMKAPPPDVSGGYSGNVVDHRFGPGTIDVDIAQDGSKLTGTWDTDVNGGAQGTLKGSVKPNGKVHMRLKITGQGGCGLNMQGIFQNNDEIVGKYQVTGCGHADHGTVDMTD